jgi:hypothetical protein
MFLKKCTLFRIWLICPSQMGLSASELYSTKWWASCFVQPCISSRSVLKQIWALQRPPVSFLKTCVHSIFLSPDWKYDRQHWVWLSYEYIHLIWINTLQFFLKNFMNLRKASSWFSEPVVGAETFRIRGASDAPSGPCSLFGFMKGSGFVPDNASFHWLSQ